MFNCLSDEDTTMIIGDDWVFPFVCFDPPAPSVTVAPVPPQPTYDFYVPNQPPAAPVQPPAAQTGPPQDLTGFVATANLIAPGQAPVLVTTDIQSPDNLLSAGQIRIIVPHTLTSTLKPTAFGAGLPVKLHVQLTDPRGFIETLTTVHIVAKAP